MKIKKLNEEIEQLLEISDETKQAVVDKRRQNATDAMDKYARAAKLASRKKSTVPAYDDEVKEDQPSRIQLAINALKEGNFEQPELQAELETMTLADVIEPNLDQFNVDELANIMNKFGGQDNTLFPTNWNDDMYGPYPIQLAQALVTIDAEESITDLYNIFYSNRSISKEAINLFKLTVLQDKKERNLNALAEIAYDSEELFPILDQFIEHWPVFTNKLIQAMHGSGNSKLSNAAIIYEDQKL